MTSSFRRQDRCKAEGFDAPGCIPGPCDEATVCQDTACTGPASQHAVRALCRGAPQSLQMVCSLCQKGGDTGQHDVAWDSARLFPTVLFVLESSRLGKGLALKSMEESCSLKDEAEKARGTLSFLFWRPPHVVHAVPSAYEDILASWANSFWDEHASSFAPWPCA